MTTIPKRLYPQTVTIASHAAGYNDYGKPIPGASQDYPARIDTGERIVRSAGGEEVVVRVSIKVPGDVPLEEVFSITVPEYGSRPIVGYKKIMGSREVKYTEIYVS